MESSIKEVNCACKAIHELTAGRLTSGCHVFSINCLIVIVLSLELLCSIDSAVARVCTEHIFKKYTVIIGVSVSEPHTSLFNNDFS